MVGNFVKRAQAVYIRLLGDIRRGVIDALSIEHRGNVIEIILIYGGPTCWVEVYPDRAVFIYTWGNDEYREELSYYDFMRLLDILKEYGYSF